MTTEQNSHRLQFDVFLILLTAALTGVASWFATRYQLDVAHRDKLYDSKVAYFDRTVKEFSEFRSTSYIYFFDYLAACRGEPTNDSDSKHYGYHHEDSELHTCLLIIPFFFGESVKKKAEELSHYLDSTPWEGTIQSPSFVAKARAIDTNTAGSEAITQLVSQELHYDDYLTLTRDLTLLMAKEISDGNTR